MVRLIRRTHYGLFTLGVLGSLLSIWSFNHWVRTRTPKATSMQRSTMLAPLTINESVGTHPFSDKGPQDGIPPIPAIRLEVPDIIMQRICNLARIRDSPFASLHMDFVGNPQGSLDLVLDGLSGATLQGTGVLKSLRSGYKIEPIVRMDEPSSDGRHMVGEIRLIDFDGKQPCDVKVDFDMLVHLRKAPPSVGASVEPTGANIRWSFQP